MFTSAVLSLSTSVRRKIAVTRDWTRQPSSGRTQKPRSGHGVNYQQTGTRQPFYRPEHANLPRVEPRVMVLTIYSPEPFLGLNPETLGHGLNYQQTGTRHLPRVEPENLGSRCQLSTDRKYRSCSALHHLMDLGNGQRMLPVMQFIWFKGVISF